MTDSIVDLYDLLEYVKDEETSDRKHLIPMEKAIQFRQWITDFPKSEISLSAEVLHRENIYDEVILPSGSEVQEVNVFVVLPTISLPPDSQNLTVLLTKMAEDSKIQSELAAIDTEFAIAQMDGLVIE
jgi:hypothetical protein